MDDITRTFLKFGPNLNLNKMPDISPDSERRAIAEKNFKAITETANDR